MKLLEKWKTVSRLQPIGLDIGTYAVKAVIVKPVSSGWEAVAAGWEDVEQAQDPTEPLAARQTAAIRRCLAQLPPSSRPYAVCAVSGPETAVRGFSFPPIPIESLDQAVSLEAQQVCPLDMRQSVLDYQLLEDADPKNPKRTGLMAAAASELVAQRRQCVEAAGAQTILMDIEGLAALNCLNALENLDLYETVGLIDLGMTMTHLAVLCPSGQPFVRDILHGGKDIIGQIAQACGKSFQEIQTELWQSDGQICSRVLKELYQAIRPLIQNISETIKYVASEQKIAFAQKIYLCGAGATVRAVVELLSDAVPSDVSVFDPFKKIQITEQTHNAELLSERGAEFVAAAGLAMRTV